MPQTIIIWKQRPRMQMGGGNGNGGQAAEALLDQYGTDLNCPC